MSSHLYLYKPCDSLVVRFIFMNQVKAIYKPVKKNKVYNKIYNTFM